MEKFKQRTMAWPAKSTRRPGPAAQRIYLPGEMEWERRDLALAEGIRFPDDVLASLHGPRGRVRPGPGSDIQLNHRDTEAQRKRRNSMATKNTKRHEKNSIDPL